MTDDNHSIDETADDGERRHPERKREGVRDRAHEDQAIDGENSANVPDDRIWCCSSRYITLPTPAVAAPNR